MSIKEISTFVRKDFLYTGSDDDEYAIVYLNTTDRKYVEISKIEKEGESEKVTFDLAMLCDIVDRLRPPVDVSKRVKTGLNQPEIVDKRSLGSVQEIQATVDEAMSRQEGNAPPGESLVKEYHKFRTGVSMEDQKEIEETPSQWKGDDEQWQKDAAARKERESTKFKEKGAIGQGFKRGGVSPEELI